MARATSQASQSQRPNRQAFTLGDLGTRLSEASPQGASSRHSSPLSPSSAHSNSNDNDHNHSNAHPRGLSVAASGGALPLRVSIFSSLLTAPLNLLQFIYTLCMLPFGDGRGGASATCVSSRRKKKYTGREPPRDVEGETDVSHREDPSAQGGDATSASELDALLARQWRSSSKIAFSANEDSSLDLDDFLSVKPSPALTTLLDDALYRACRAELVPTVAAGSRLLAELLKMKEASALVWRECRWMVGVPNGWRIRGGGHVSIGDVEQVVAGSVACGVGSGCYRLTKRQMDKLHDNLRNGFFFGCGVIADKHGNPYCPAANHNVDDKSYKRWSSNGSSSSFNSNRSSFGSYASCSSGNANSATHVEEMNCWNDFDIMEDFAKQCYLGVNEVIQRLTTDPLAETANLTLQDSLVAAGNHHRGGGKKGHFMPPSPTLPADAPSPPSLSPATASPADVGIGRCYPSQLRHRCWESPRLHCPDYYWADDAVGACQRLLKVLGKHRLVSLVAAHGWERYHCNVEDQSVGGDNGWDAVLGAVSATDCGGHYATAEKGAPPGCARALLPPAYAATAPHPFPSLEAVHALRYLVTHLLPSSIPARLNQFRAAVESNAVVSKRLYLVKCEYRAPMRALWESYGNLAAAPRMELVESYLREHHGVKVATKDSAASATSGGGNSGTVAGGGGHGEGAGAGASGGGKLRRKHSTEVAKKTALQEQRERLEVRWYIVQLFNFSSHVLTMCLL